MDFQLRVTRRNTLDNHDSSCIDICACKPDSTIMVVCRPNNLAVRIVFGHDVNLEHRGLPDNHSTRIVQIRVESAVTG